MSVLERNDPNDATHYFPEGTEVIILRRWSDTMFVCTCEEKIDVEQPEDFLVGYDEIGD